MLRAASEAVHTKPCNQQYSSDKHLYLGSNLTFTMHSRGEECMKLKADTLLVGLYA